MKKRNLDVRITMSTAGSIKLVATIFEDSKPLKSMTRTIKYRSDREFDEHAMTSILQAAAAAADFWARQYTLM